MAIIKKLAPDVASKIAAGEVVEKPFNVVKELIENSCDAEATKIVVEISDGGLAKIKIADNGKGIDKEDLPLALERFATSKAESVEDVYGAKTFGFRGEALAAISSVSDFTIRSGRNGTAYEINSNYGVIGEVKPAPAITGTTIEVSKLFENLPARRKFLKGAKSLETEISKLIKHFSLINPHIDITLLIDGKENFHASINDSMTERCSMVFSNKVFNLGEVEDEYIKVMASCTIPSSSDRLKRDAIILGVNGRLIKDPSLVQAVVSSYFRMIPDGRYPCAAINIIMDPSGVDANVHPAKLEVRFENPKEIFSLVQRACQASFKGKGVSMEFKLTEPNIFSNGYDNIDKAINFSQNNEMVRENNEKIEELSFSNKSMQDIKPLSSNDLSSSNINESYISDNRNSSYDFNANQNDGFNNSNNINRLTNNNPNNNYRKEREDFSESYNPGESNYFNDYGVNNETNESIVNSFPSKQENPNFAFSFDELLEKESYTVENKKEVYETLEDRISNGEFRVVGQIDNTYILIETNHKEILFIDQHVAHERILFEKINFENETKDKPSVVLHDPLEVKLTDEIVDEIDDYKLLIENFGYGYEKVNNETVKVIRIPYSSVRRDIVKEFRLIVQDLCVDGNSKTEDAPRAMLSCKSAIKAGDPLTVEEMEYLVKLLFQTNNFGTCPHGRPIIYAMTISELGRKFLRC